MDYEGTERYIFDGARGINIPYDFCKGMILEAFGLSEDDPDVIECLKGPEGSEYYCEAWASILDKAKHTDTEGYTWTLHEDDGLYMVRDDILEEWFR